MLFSPFRPARYRQSLLGLFLALPLCALGCDDESTGPGDAPQSDAGPGDSGLQDVQQPDSDAATSSVTFAPAGTLGEGALGLRLASESTAENVVLEVVLGPMSNVYGLGASLTYDAAKLEFESFESLHVLESAEGLSVAKVNPPGRLSFALSKKGNQKGIAIQSLQAVAKIHLRVLGKGSSALSFVPARTSVRNDRLEHASTSRAWIGGQLTVE